MWCLNDTELGPYLSAASSSITTPPPPLPHPGVIRGEGRGLLSRYSDLVGPIYRTSRHSGPDAKTPALYALTGQPLNYHVYKVGR